MVKRSETSYQKYVRTGEVSDSAVEIDYKKLYEDTLKAVYSQNPYQRVYQPYPYWQYPTHYYDPYMYYCPPHHYDYLVSYF